jgi:hypothetical protein
MNTTVAPATTAAPRIAGRERTCEQCGTIYRASRASSRYCSGKCRVQAHRSRPSLSVTEAPLAGGSLESGTPLHPTPCNALERIHGAPKAIPETIPSPPVGAYATLLLNGRHVRYVPGNGPAPLPPQFIQSAYGEQRVYPRTYAEHGQPLPDYLKVRTPHRR